MDITKYFNIQWVTIIIIHPHNVMERCINPQSIKDKQENYNTVVVIA